MTGISNDQHLPAIVHELGDPGKEDDWQLLVSCWTSKLLVLSFIPKKQSAQGVNRVVSKIRKPGSQGLLWFSNVYTIMLIKLAMLTYPLLSAEPKWYHRSYHRFWLIPKCLPTPLRYLKWFYPVLFRKFRRHLFGRLISCKLSPPEAFGVIKCAERRLYPCSYPL